MKTYRGSPAAARNYVEAGRSRADDYYLAEGTGVAERYAASPDAEVRRLEPLTGDRYEAWVAGIDPETGAPKGRLRHDQNAVRFVEVVVNGPKSWSLAAELHPDISAAYDAAQDAAAQQIIAWLAQHATTRVGPRGAQVQVPIAELEAVTVRHHTSRAGDPHRHLHLQINARVFAHGVWRGLHTVGVRDSLDAINGIGHAAVMSDPGFRAALAAHGFTLDPGTGEVAQLAKFVGPFSARAAQIGRNIDRYEAEWRAANPHREPGLRLRRAWDARAWADARPDKITPRDGDDLTRRWITELRELGYRDPTAPVPLNATSIGGIGRDHAAAEVLLTRLAARRSAWNSSDIRGEVEQLIARRNVVAAPGVRGELAEDLTARALNQCVPLLDRPGVPEHVRALTSRRVLDVEADLVARLAARGSQPHAPHRQHAHVGSDAVNGLDGLDAAQRDVVVALSGDRTLVLLEGAAGAGKTTTLAAARTSIHRQGGRLVVVTPSLKAAQVAARQLHAPASSAARLAHRYGWRWDDNGAWHRLAPGQIDPATGIVYTGADQHTTRRTDRHTVLRRGDLLVVDEAGMLDQDTARALLTLADETGARVALLGDRHQLPAIGRGGVLDLAARWTDPAAHLCLDTVRRFTRTVTGPGGATSRVADEQYAALSLAMRAGDHPAAVFDALRVRGQIRVHASETERAAALADQAVRDAADGVSAAVIADTREQVTALNQAIRGRLVAAGCVDDTHATSTGAGQRIGVGDRVATRRNAPDLAVANRDTWTVTAIAADGLIVSGEQGTRTLPTGYVREHLELAYATTVHGVQGDTTTTAHVAIGEHTSAASAYVAMTRGREANLAHFVAADIDDAREQWIAAFARDHADLGPTHTRTAAERAAAGYATAAAPADSSRLAVVLEQLRHAWTEQHAAHADLAHAQQIVNQTQTQADWWAHCQTILSPLQQRLHHTHQIKQAAAKDAAGCATILTDTVARRAAELRRTWDQQLGQAAEAARAVAAGPGRLGLHRGRVRDAQARLDDWAQTWAPAFAGSSLGIDTVRRDPDRYGSWTAGTADALHDHAQRLAAADHPDLVARLRALDDADAEHQAASHAYYGARARLGRQSSLPIYDLGAAEKLPALRERADAAQQRVQSPDRHVQRLVDDPAIASQLDPAAVLVAAREHWDDNRARQAANLRLRHAAHQPTISRPSEPYTPRIQRQGPSISR